jgi:hypothetical protein
MATHLDWIESELQLLLPHRNKTIIILLLAVILIITACDTLTIPNNKKILTRAGFISVIKYALSHHSNP